MTSKAVGNRSLMNLWRVLVKRSDRETGEMNYSRQD